MKKKILRCKKWDGVDSLIGYSYYDFIDIASGNIIFSIINGHTYGTYRWYASDNNALDYLLNQDNQRFGESPAYKTFDEAKADLIEAAYICGYEILDDYLHTYV
jgi:hypothetical protein